LINKVIYFYVKEFIMEKFVVLSQSSLFRNINNDDMFLLLEKVHYQIKSYSTGQIVVYSGDECNELQIVLSGSVRGEMMDMAGRVLKIEDIGVARPLAVAFIFGNNNSYPVTVTANEEVKFLVLPRESVLKMMQLNVSFLTNFMNDVSNRAQFISGKLKFLSFQTLKGKLAHYILEQEKKGHGGRIVMDKTQEKLADLFGVARPSLGRIIRQLHNEGVIFAEGKNIEIKNRKKLQSYLV